MSDETKPVEITLESFLKFAETNEDARKHVQAIKDKAVTSALKTYEENFMKEKFPKILDEEVSKRLPAPLTDAEKRLQELEIKFQRTEQEKKVAQLQSILLKKANEKGLPDFLVDYAVSEDEETSYSKLETLGSKYLEHVNKAVEERLSTSGGRKAPLNTDGKVENIGLANLPNDPDWYIKNADALDKLMNNK